eukprot:SAG11_NODE_191_length_12943_cov_3.853706_6_plen_169_part_00
MGSWSELLTYGSGFIMVIGNVEREGGLNIEPMKMFGSGWFPDVAAYTILVVMTSYAVWCAGLGIKDELDSRREQKKAVAHILFAQMDADGSGKLNFEEVQQLCERLGKKLTDAEVTKALLEMGGEDMEADADEFVEWWIHHVRQSNHSNHPKPPLTLWNAAALRDILT